MIFMESPRFSDIYAARAQGPNGATTTFPLTTKVGSFHTSPCSTQGWAPANSVPDFLFRRPLESKICLLMYDIHSSTSNVSFWKRRSRADLCGSSVLVVPAIGAGARWLCCSFQTSVRTGPVQQKNTS